MGFRDRDEENPTRRVADYDELYPGRFLKAALFKGRPCTLVIAEVFVERMPGKGSKKEWKAVLGFLRTEMQLVLNKTNGLCLREMFGRDVTKWVGKSVTFYPRMVDVGGAEELAIRVLGSPDIPQDMPVTIDLPRKKPYTLKMQRTGQAKVQPSTAQPVAAAPATAPTQPPASEPVVEMEPEFLREPGADEDTGDPFDFGHTNGAAGVDH